MTTSTTLLLILIPNILFITISVYATNRIIKVKSKDLVESLIEKINIENLNLDNCLSKEVVNVYIDVLANTNDWSLISYQLVNKKLAISIWTANSITDREFHSIEGCTLNILEVNKSLTKYDKLLLDKIVENYKNRESKLITKIFINM